MKKIPLQILFQELRDGIRSAGQDTTRELRGWAKDGKLDELLNAVNDIDMDVRRSVLDALGVFEDSRIEPILENALFDEEWEVKWAALRSLGTLWQEPYLKHMGDKFVEKRIHGIENITKKRLPQFLNPLLSALDDEEDVQIASVHALAFYGSDQAVQPLKALHENATIEFKAILEESLFRLGHPIYPQGQHRLHCHVCAQAMPFSSLKKVHTPHGNQYLCSFHFDEYQEKVQPFQGKLKECKITKEYWPKSKIVEGLSPPQRLKRYRLLPSPPEGKFRCFYSHKLRHKRDLSPIKDDKQFLSHRSAYQLASQTVNSPFLTEDAIEFLKSAFAHGYVLCERSRVFLPISEIDQEYHFRDFCTVSQTNKKDIP